MAKKNFKATVPAAQFINPEDLEESTTADRREKPAGAKRDQRMTFLCTPATMEELEALANLYRLRNTKLNGKTVTVNALLNIAVEDYLAKHADDIREYRELVK